MLGQVSQFAEEGGRRRKAYPGRFLILVYLAQPHRSVLSYVQVGRTTTPRSKTQAEERLSHQTIDISRRHIPSPCRLWSICPRSGGSRKPSAAWVTDVIFGDNEDNALLAYLYHGISAASEWLSLANSGHGRRISLHLKQQSIMGLAEKAVVSETRLDGSQDPIEVKPKSSWKGYLWDTWALPQDQRRLLFKLDAFVLTFASVRVLSTESLSIQYNTRHTLTYSTDWLLSQES